jgi:hypothetical protein
MMTAKWNALISRPLRCTAQGTLALGYWLQLDNGTNTIEGAAWESVVAFKKAPKDFKNAPNDGFYQVTETGSLSRALKLAATLLLTGCHPIK